MNAIAYGKGAAFGIDLWTKALVKLSRNEDVIEVSIKNEPQENPLLAEKCVKRVLDYFGVERCGALVRVESCIPIAKGLKSSSAAANAITLATVKALNHNLEDLEIVRLGVDSAIEAKVTVTGAFDDACASYFGDVILTDNKRKTIEKKFTANRNLRAILFIPPSKSYTADVNVGELKKIEPLIQIIYNKAYQGDYWKAMSLNGFTYSTILKQNSQVALDALYKGAIAAGLSGKGPSTVAVCQEDKVDDIVDVWACHEGEIKVNRINSNKAHILGG